MRKSKRFLLICGCVVFFTGLLLTLYPVLSGAVLEYRQLQKSQSFFQRIPSANAPEETPADTEQSQPTEGFDYLADLRSAAAEYNARLFSDGQVLDSPGVYEEPCLALADYGLPDGVFGVLSIPELKLEMPIYLGASKENLALGAAQLGQTSIPIGGANTNCVIAGHRSWKGAAYFRDLPKLEPGDEITITNPWETLHYTVTEQKIIFPSNSDAVQIQPEKDLLTLLTCYYSTNGLKYRYIIIGERTV